jgi:hypothetical protein
MFGMEKKMTRVWSGKKKTGVLIGRRWLGVEKGIKPVPQKWALFDAECDATRFKYRCQGVRLS